MYIYSEMSRKLFIFLLTIGAIKYRSTSIPFQCANRVSKCPLGKNAWTQKNDQWKCATDYGYVCMRDSKGYLFEGCIANFTIHASEGNCPTLFACLKNESYLGKENTYYVCPEEVSGCPPKNHAEYSIHQLYKYPKCVESNFSDETGNTSPRLNTSISMSTTSTYQVSKETEHYVILIVFLAILLTIVAGCFIGYIAYTRTKRRKYDEVTYEENENRSEEYAELSPEENEKESKEDYKDLRCWIQKVNESEADRIRILPLKEDDTIEVDRTYVPLSIKDENEKHSGKSTAKQTISELTPDKMFNTARGRPARSIFMLGDAGYGKTVQCKRIAKSWCKAWKADAHHLNNVHVIENEKNKEWEKYLKDFELLFYVPMRGVNNGRVHIRDMILDCYRRFDISQEHLEHLDDILNVLKSRRYKCLIILDGLDEWNLSESKKKFLLNKGLPNRDGMLNCTFLFTMRSWKFMEVDYMCRQGLYNKVLLLHGLDNNGFEELTTNMLCNYFNIDRHSQEFQEQCTNVWKKAYSMPELKSFKNIPLLAVFFILACHDQIETGHSLTTFYLSITEALIKRSQTQLERKVTSKLSVSSIVNNYPYVLSRQTEICCLGKLAFENLDSRHTTFVVKDVHLEDPEVKKTVHFFLTIGILTKHDTTGQIHEDNVKFSFLHKTFQEFIYTLYLVHDKSEADVVKSITDMVPDIEKTQELSIVLTFVSGLSPAVGCTVSSHIAELTSTDEDICRYRYNYPAETYYKVFHLYNLQLSCYREVRRGESIGNFQGNEIKFSFSDIILIGDAADRLTIRETADVLCYHANEIISLCLKFLPDDDKEGITNDELKTFLQESDSLVSLNIDGHDRGNCRFFRYLNLRAQCLRTISFQNVAFADIILADFLMREESKRSIKVLGLSYIKSADDLKDHYQYHFPSLHGSFKEEYGHLQRRNMCQASEKSLSKVNRQPLLNNILKELPNYHHLSTLHISYMNSVKDRKMLLKVLPGIRTLEHFGYDGSSIDEDEENGDVYDAEVIKVLLNIGRLRTIFLCQIILKENIMNFTRMTLLGEIRLIQFYMEESHWATFAKSLSSIKPLPRVVLWDTDIDNETFDRLSSSLTIINVDSTEWNRKTSRRNQRQLDFK